MLALSEYIENKNNNFNLIRFLSAIAVIFSHSFILANGPQNGADPFAKIVGFPLSSIAVDTFFFISGLLVTKSLIDRKSVLTFILARCLRIFPGLIVAVFFSAFVVGLITSELPVLEYVKHPDVTLYIFRNIWIFDNVIQYSLPGVFLNTPTHAVNGSLWSLPWEVYMYFSIMTLFIINKAKINISLLVTSCFVYLLFLFQKFDVVEVSIISPVYMQLITMFYTGVLFYLFRERIKLSGIILLVMLVVFFLIKDSIISKVLFPAFLSYFISCFAYLIRGKLLSFNKIGDFSYGTYIYAFPIQQMLVFYISPGDWALFMYSSIITILISIISWHYVEFPALMLKNKIMNFGRKTIKLILFK